MAITYTISQCEANILAWDAKIEALAGLPEAGEIGRDRVEGLDKALASAKSQRLVWVGRLMAARNGGKFVGTRRVL